MCLYKLLTKNKYFFYFFTQGRLTEAFLGWYPQSHDLHWLKIILARITMIRMILFGFMKANLINV